MTNFRKVEIKAYSKDEAISKAPFAILKDATQSWKNAGKPVMNGMIDFMLDYLKKNTKNAPGVGCIITVKPGVADSRERPYKINDIINEVVTGTVTKKDEDGNEIEVPTTKRKFVTTYVIVDDETNEILDKSYENKTEARRRLAELYVDGYKGKATCFYTKEVIEGEPRAFTGEYCPSINTELGCYLAFGFMNDDSVII